MSKKQKTEFKKMVVSPSTQLFLSCRVNKDTELHEVIDKEDNMLHIEQDLKDLVLTTKVKRKYVTMSIEHEEETTLKQKLYEGMELVYGEEEGWVISPYKMKTPSEVIEDLKVIKDL